MTVRDQLQREIKMPGFVLPSVVAMTIAAAGLAAGPQALLGDGGGDDDAATPRSADVDEFQRLTIDDAFVTTSSAGTWLGLVSSPVDPAARLSPLPLAADQQASADEPTPTATVRIDTTDRRQTWLGVGGALTDASVELLEQHDEAVDRLFDRTRDDSARLNLVRLPTSATDFSRRTWTSEMRGRFKPAPELRRATRMVGEILDVRPDIEVVATAWTAPAGMVGADGRLTDTGAYADLLLATTTWLRGRDVPVHAITLGNEPGYRAEYPSMLMSDDQMIELGERVAPGLDPLGIELWALDHNWNDRGRVDDLTRRSPGTFDAAAFHCYGGTPDQMAGLPVPPIVTECTGTDDNWTSTFGWDSRVIVSESIRAGSTGLMMWNLVLPPEPEVLPGGCDLCRGLLTVDPETGDIIETPEFYTLAHLSRAADPGAVVVTADAVDRLPVVAFANPDGSIGIFGHNDTPDTQVVEFVLSDGDSLVATVAPWSMFDLRSEPTGGLTRP